MSEYTLWKSESGSKKSADTLKMMNINGWKWSQPCHMLAFELFWPSKLKNGHIWAQLCGWKWSFNLKITQKNVKISARKHTTILKMLGKGCGKVWFLVLKVWRPPSKVQQWLPSVWRQLATSKIGYLKFVAVIGNTCIWWISPSQSEVCQIWAQTKGW